MGLSIDIINKPKRLNLGDIKKIIPVTPVEPEIKTQPQESPIISDLIAEFNLTPERISPLPDPIPVSAIQLRDRINRERGLSFAERVSLREMAKELMRPGVGYPRTFLVNKIKEENRVTTTQAEGGLDLHLIARTVEIYFGDYYLYQTYRTNKKT